jgi:hypothetical protein
MNLSKLVQGSTIQLEKPVNKGNLKHETSVQFYEIRRECLVRIQQSTYPNRLKSRSLQ